MRKTLVVLAVVLLALASGGCYGPQKVTRQVDDWIQQGYIDEPWLFGNTVSWGLIFTSLILTHLLDGLVVNPMDFWGQSAWPAGKGWGTPFNHRTPRMPAPH